MLSRLLLDPDPEGVGGGSGQAGPGDPEYRGPLSSPAEQVPGRDLGSSSPASPAGGESTSSPSSADSGVSGRVSVPGDPNQAAGVSAPPQSLREVATQRYGIEFDPRVQDDDAALAWLVDQARRAQQSDMYSQLGRQLAPHAPKIRDYMKGLSAQQESSPAWQPPPFDERWMAMVEQDGGTGLYVGKHPNVPHEIVDAVNRRAEWQRSYANDPVGMLHGMVEQRARAIAEEVTRQQFDRHSRAQEIEQIRSRNAEWFYARTQDGRLMQDGRGQFVPSQHGAAYIRHLQAVVAAGVSDPRSQDSLALQLLRGELAQQGQQQPATQQPAAQAHGRPNINPLGNLPADRRPAVPGASDPSFQGLSIAERLREEFRRAGITDNDFRDLEFARQ